MRGDSGRDIGPRLLMTHRCLGKGVWRGAKGGTLPLAEWTKQMDQCTGRRQAMEQGGKPCHCTVRKAKGREFHGDGDHSKNYILLPFALETCKAKCLKQNVWKAKNCNPGKNYVRGQKNQHGMLGMKKECHGRNLRLEALWRNGIC